MQRLAFSRFIGLTCLYLGPLIKSFLKALFLMIRRSPVTIYICGIYQQNESYYICMVDYLGLLKLNTILDCNKLIELKTLVDTGGVSF